MSKIKLNRPGAPANQAQHTLGDYGDTQGVPQKPELADASKSADGLPTGRGTAAANDVFDPHPSDEEHYDRSRPGGARAKEERAIGPNNAVHDGHAPRRPSNAENDGTLKKTTRSTPS